MKNRTQLELFVKQGYIKSVPEGDSYEDFIDMLREMYSPYTLDFVAKECRIEPRMVEKLFDMFIDAGP